MRFLTDGETIFVLADKKEKILDALARGHMVFALAIGELIEELKDEVKKLSQERKHKVTVNRKSYNVVLHSDTEDGGFLGGVPDASRLFLAGRHRGRDPGYDQGCRHGAPGCGGGA
jgi:hypothetical protein